MALDALAGTLGFPGDMAVLGQKGVNALRSMVGWEPQPDVNRPLPTSAEVQAGLAHLGLGPAADLTPGEGAAYPEAEKYIYRGGVGALSGALMAPFGGGLLKGVASGLGGAEIGGLAADAAPDSALAPLIGGVVGGLGAGGLAATGEGLLAAKGARTAAKAAQAELAAAQAQKIAMEDNPVKAGLVAQAQAEHDGIHSAADEAIGHIVDAHGGPQSLQAAGEAAQRDARTWVTGGSGAEPAPGSYPALREAQFAPIEANVPQNTPMPLTNFSRALEDLTQENGSLEPYSQLFSDGRLRTMRQRYEASRPTDESLATGEARPEPMLGADATWAEGRRLREQIGSALADPSLAKSPEAANYTRLYGALSDDQRTAVAGLPSTLTKNNGLDFTGQMNLQHFPPYLPDGAVPPTPSFQQNYTGPRFDVDGGAFGGKGAYLDNTGGDWGTLLGRDHGFPVSANFSKGLVISPQTIEQVGKQFGENGKILLGKELADKAQAAGYDGIIVKGFPSIMAKGADYEAGLKAEQVAKANGLSPDIVQNQVFSFHPEKLSVGQSIPGPQGNVNGMSLVDLLDQANQGTARLHQVAQDTMSKLINSTKPGDAPPGGQVAASLLGEGGKDGSTLATLRQYLPQTTDRLLAAHLTGADGTVDPSAWAKLSPEARAALAPEHAQMLDSTLRAKDSAADALAAAKTQATEAQRVAKLANARRLEAAQAGVKSTATDALQQTVAQGFHGLTSLGAAGVGHGVGIDLGHNLMSMMGSADAGAVLQHGSQGAVLGGLLGLTAPMVARGAYGVARRPANPLMGGIAASAIPTYTVRPRPEDLE